MKQINSKTTEKIQAILLKKMMGLSDIPFPEKYKRTIKTLIRDLNRLPTIRKRPSQPILEAPILIVANYQHRLIPSDFFKDAILIQESGLPDIICVSPYMVQKNQDIIPAVLSHELGHMRDREKQEDVLFSEKSRVSAWSSCRDSCKRLRLIKTVKFGLSAQFHALKRSWMSQTAEFVADGYGAALVGKEEMIECLVTLHREYGLSETLSEKLKRPFASHPAPAARINAIRREAYFPGK
jgi:Zn-dependent protease with chaperone function